MSTTEGAAQKRDVIQKLNWSHKAMADVMLARPEVSKNELAKMFDRTPGWISQVTNSDAFQAYLAERRETEVVPLIAASIQDRLSNVAALALERLAKKFEVDEMPLTDDFVLQSAKLAVGALGYGAKPLQAGGTTNVAVVIQVPQKIPSATEWATVHQAAP